MPAHVYRALSSLNISRIWPSRTETRQKPIVFLSLVPINSTEAFIPATNWRLKVSDRFGKGLKISEFMVLPTGATSFEEAMQIVTECYHSLKSVITAKFGLGGELSRLDVV